MIGRFSWRTAVAVLVVAGFGLAARAVPAGADHGAQIHQWCDAEYPPESAIESLVDEAEATGMPEKTLNRLLAVGYRGNGTSGHLRDILCAVVLAEEEGLPPGLLFDKLEEGLGKRVALPRILTVIRYKVDDLRFARKLLAAGQSNLVDDPNVDRIARVLSLGVPRGEMSELFRQSKQTPVDMFVIAAEILGFGRTLEFAPPLVQEVIAAGLQYRAFTPEWVYFTKVVTEARRRGIPDDKTAGTAVAVLSENGTLDELIGELGLNIKPARKDDR